VKSCVGMFWEMCSHCLLGLGVGCSWWVGLQVCTVVSCRQIWRAGYSGMSDAVGVDGCLLSCGCHGNLGIYLYIIRMYVVQSNLVGTQSVKVERCFILLVRGFTLIVTAVIGGA